MYFELLDIAWYDHYKVFAFFKIEIGLGNWVGHLLFFEWDKGDIEWDLFFLNAAKPSAVG